MAEYRIHDPDKGIIGPIRLETARDLVKAGAVHDGVWVSRDGGAFLPLKAFEELAAPAAVLKETDPQPTYSGDLGKNTFFKVFHRFHVTQSTGLLVVRREDKRKDIFLEGGQPVFVASNLLHERFGEYLLARGKIDRHEVDVALQSMHTDRNRLGHTLIRLGLLAPEEVYEELRGQQKSRLVDLCTWQSGRYQFFEGQKYKGDKVDLKLEVPDLIATAGRQLDLKQLESRLINWVRSVPQRPAGHLGELDALHLSDVEKRIVDAVDGKKTIEEIIAAIGSDEISRRTTLMVLYIMWEIDAVSFKP